MRIEVGTGLKEKLPEESAARIVRDRIAPRCRNGDYNGCVEAGIQAIIAQLQGEEQAPAAARTEEASGSDSFFEGPDLSITERILIGSFVFGIIGLFTVIGILTPGAGWFLYFFLIPFWAMFPIVVVGTHGTLIVLVTYLVGFPLVKVALRRHDWYRNALADLKTKGVAHIGGFVVKSGKAANSWESS